MQTNFFFFFINDTIFPSTFVILLYLRSEIKISHIYHVYRNDFAQILHLTSFAVDHKFASISKTVLREMYILE